MPYNNYLYKNGHFLKNIRCDTQIQNVSFSGINDKKISKNDIQHIEGCLAGGAVGDAMGARIEAWSYADIKKAFGPLGLRNLLTRDNIADTTDDTQMTLFTALGLIRAKLANGGEASEEACLEEVSRAYHEWYLTQSISFNSSRNNENFLLRDERMYAKKFPGATCIESLKADNGVKFAENDSAGNGAIMRSAPFGLLFADDPEKAFKVSIKCARLTHGNPDGYLPAAAFSYLIALIVQGNPLEDAVRAMCKRLEQEGCRGIKISNLVNKAIKFANTDINDYEAISVLGKGFTGKEALAVSVYSSLKHQDNFKEGIVSSINHDGDSDTTGSITGNILGAYLGKNAIPSKFLNKVDLINNASKMAKGLYLSIVEIPNPEKDFGIAPKFAQLPERLNMDTFDFKPIKIRFSDSDVIKMSKMNLKDALEYRSYLIRTRKYTTD